MNKKYRYLVVFLSMCLYMLAWVSPVQASELKFSVNPLVPDNQVNREHTYFDLLVKPDQKQTITIHLENDTDKDVTIEQSVYPATTNINGVVEYGLSNEKLDETATYDISKLVIPEQEEITIPAKSEIDAHYAVNIPEKAFPGILAGGITLQEKEAEEQKEQEEDAQGLAIENKYAYVVAILLRETEVEVESSVKLSSIEAGQVNARNVINATVQNTEPKYENQVSINTEIRKKGTENVLYKSQTEGMQIAPNTSLTYPTRLEGEKLEPGTYELSMDVASDNNTWSFKREFTIAAETAKKLNKSDVSIQEINEIVYWLLAVALLAILGLGMYLWKRKAAKHSE